MTLLPSLFPARERDRLAPVDLDLGFDLDLARSPLGALDRLWERLRLTLISLPERARRDLVARLPGEGEREPIETSPAVVFFLGAGDRESERGVFERPLSDMLVMMLGVC
jgi:hypothetical protein